jgi:hypothetical protein
VLPANALDITAHSAKWQTGRGTRPSENSGKQKLARWEAERKKQLAIAASGLCFMFFDCFLYLFIEFIAFATVVRWIRGRCIVHIFCG